MKKNLLRAALNFELSAPAAAPPAELPLIPAGSPVMGRDGRSWNNPNPQGVVDYFTSRGVDLPFDIEHSTELKAPQGDAAPAAAWVKKLIPHDDGSVWGAIDWNDNGRELVMNREYRYYSTVLIYNKTTGDIVGISSVGLTNKPNLDVTALNHEQNNNTEVYMLKKLLAALGLAETSTEDVALNHIATLKSDLTTALNRAQTPDLALFIPRAQFDAACNKANNAEKALNELKSAETEKALNSEIEAALKAGKIVPATKEFYIAMCRQEGGLAKFKEFVAAAPVIGGESNLDNHNIDAGGEGKALNAAQKEVCAKMGISEEDYAKAL